MNTMVIGIAGGTGSGKTTLTKRIQKRFGDHVSTLYHDNYYKDQGHLTLEERCKQNYDHPNSFDTQLMVELLRQVRDGQSISCPFYDYTLHTRSNAEVAIAPARVVVVEGILIFHDPELRELMDVKIFVDTDDDVRILRRMLRDVEDRGRSMESVITQYLQTVKPMHTQFVQPSRQYADLVILEGGHNEVALEVIVQRVASHVGEEM